MDDAARVLLECAAAPDDDAPRLVWADKVGGERGELVVVQCDLARGDLPLHETRRRRARERSLLERNAVAWAGDLREVAQRWTFRRGFIEAARLARWRPLHRWPLLRSVMLDSWPAPDEPGLDQLVALGIGRAYPARPLPRLPSLRALACSELDDDALPHVLAAVAGAPLTQLRLVEHRLEVAQVIALCDALPALTDLDVRGDAFHSHVLGRIVDRPLRALRIDAIGAGELAVLGNCAMTTTLEELGFTPRADDATPFPAFPRLHTIELAGPHLRHVARGISEAPPPALRRLRIHGELPRRLKRKLEDQLDLDVVALDEMLHPATLVGLGRPWFDKSEPAFLVRIDRPEIFELAARPADEPFLLGRSRLVDFTCAASSVARHHARFHWRGDHHEVQDLGTTNGTRIGDELVDRRRLRDGDTLVLGEVVLRYFIGPGARERAEAAINGSST